MRISGHDSDFRSGAMSPTQKVVFGSSRDPGPAHRHQNPHTSYSRQLTSATVPSPRNQPESGYSSAPCSPEDRARITGDDPEKGHENMTGGFLYSSPSSHKLDGVPPHTSSGRYCPTMTTKEDGTRESIPRSGTMASMYNPRLRALDNLTGQDTMHRQYGDDSGQSHAYRTALSGALSSRDLQRQSGDFTLAEAALGHSNALQLREELRVDLQQLDLLVSDIAHFRSRHAGAEIQKLKQRGSGIHQWCQSFQQWFTEKGAAIMKNAEVIRREQETLSSDVKKQFLVAQRSVESLEKQVSDLSAQLQEDTTRHQVKLANINERKERLQRQLRSLESKQATDTALHKRAILDGEKDVEEISKIVAMLEREVEAQQRESRVQDDACRERYMMCLSDCESQRQRVTLETARGMWEARFIDLVETSMKSPPVLNPVRTIRREHAWDEIENLEHELRAMDKSDDPLRSALMHIADAEVGEAKANMIQLRKLYDQTMIARKLNQGIKSTFTTLALRYPELFQKTPHELQDHFESLQAQNGLQDADRSPLDTNDPLVCGVSARHTQEHARYRQKMSVKTPGSKLEEGDISFIQNSKKRFDRDLLPADEIIGDIHQPGFGWGKIPARADQHWVDFKPKEDEKKDGSMHWATFGEAWFD